ncbi:MAG: methyltransferase domain-containing protein [Prevotella sp.]|jgi:predicted SAM-dependent methyltransferase|nr:methyltransferase domain-containing protein [Prevotella sp.]
MFLKPPPPPHQLKLLNLGCGSRYHHEWTNIDFHSTGKSVIGHNLLKGIPFDDKTFDLVYHSNVIEHFSKADAPEFINECYRVLKPNGILRVVFPDLEKIVRQYIRLLAELQNNNSQYESDYDWIMLELFDQMVRNVSGGEMFQYFVRESIPNEKFVLERCGIEAKNLIKAGKLEYDKMSGKYHVDSRDDIITRLKYVRRKILKAIDLINKKIFGRRYLASSIGRFRLGGEIHQWMYDAYSMSRMLKSSGFKQIVVRDAISSYLEGWSKYNLDTESDGMLQSDCCYIEGIK